MLMSCCVGKASLLLLLLLLLLLYCSLQDTLLDSYVWCFTRLLRYQVAVMLMLKEALTDFHLICCMIVIVHKF